MWQFLHHHLCTPPCLYIKDLKFQYHSYEPASLLRRQHVSKISQPTHKMAMSPCSSRWGGGIGALPLQRVSTLTSFSNRSGAPQILLHTTSPIPPAPPHNGGCSGGGHEDTATKLSQPYDFSREETPKWEGLCVQRSEPGPQLQRIPAADPSSVQSQETPPH